LAGGNASLIPLASEDEDMVTRLINYSPSTNRSPGLAYVVDQIAQVGKVSPQFSQRQRPELAELAIPGCLALAFRRPRSSGMQPRLIFER